MPHDLDFYMKRDYGIERIGADRLLFGKVPTFGLGFTHYSGKFPRTLDALLLTDRTSFGGTGHNVETVLAATTDLGSEILLAGMRVGFEAYIAIPTTVSTDTLRIRVRWNGLTGDVLYDSTAINVSDGDYIHLKGNVEVRTTGAAAVYRSLVHGATKLGGSAAYLPPVYVEETADHTAENVPLVITGVWSTESANSAIVKRFSVDFEQAAFPIA